MGGPLFSVCTDRLFQLGNLREWLKEEHNGELVAIAGVVHKIRKSTKGREALTAFLERIID